MTYAEQLKDPRWQKKRLKIFERDEFTCRYCGNKENTLHVHYNEYFDGKNAWEYPDDLLTTLCDSCHEKEKNRAKTEKQLLIVLRMKGFILGDLLSLNCILLSDRNFSMDLLNTLRNYQR